MLRSPGNSNNEIYERDDHRILKEQNVSDPVAAAAADHEHGTVDSPSLMLPSPAKKARTTIEQVLDEEEDLPPPLSIDSIQPSTNFGPTTSGPKRTILDYYVHKSNHYKYKTTGPLSKQVRGRGKGRGGGTPVARKSKKKGIVFKNNRPPGEIRVSLYICIDFFFY